MEKLLFIYNPHAGKGRVRSKLAGVLNAFTRAGCLTTVYPTQGPGDAVKAAKELAPQYDRLAVCGGDGTLHEVVSGLMELPESARPPIGYIPAGTTNDYARNLNLPREMEAMAGLAASGEPRPVDLGRLGERHFIYVAAFGAFTDVAYNTSQEFKNMFGHLAYVLKGVAELSSLKGYGLQLEHDGGVIEGDFLYGMVSNTVSVGGFKGAPADTVKLDDGLFECVLVRLPQNAVQLQAVIRALLQMAPDENGLVVSLRTSHLNITCPDELPWTLDGEYGGSPRQAEIQNCAQAVRIVYGK